MPWARLDDTFPFHPKVQDTLDDPQGLAAIGLWTLALARSYQAAVNRPLVLAREARRLTGGLDPDPLAAILVANGLWEPDPQGWVIHDWADFRPPFDSHEAKVLGGQARAATAPRQGGKFAPGKVVDNLGKSPAGTSSTSSPGTSNAGPAEHQQHQHNPSRPDPISSRSVPKVPSGTSRGREAWTVACPACGAKAGEPCPRVRGGDRWAVHQERLDALHRPDYLTSKAWNPFLDAWYSRFRLPPTRAQAEALWEAVDAYPAASASFVLDCPPGAKARDVIASVLERFHAVRGDAYQAAARAEVQADAQRRAEALPRRNGQGPVPVAAVLDDLPM